MANRTKSVPQPDSPKAPVEVLCTGLDLDGNGLVTIRGREVTVPHLLPGETALVQTNYAKPGAQITGKLVRLVTPSPNRRAPHCLQFGKCGGCQLLHMQAAAQLAWKEEQVRGLLAKFGPVSPILGMEDPYHYRNKVVGSFAMQGKRPISGIYQAGTHRVAPIDDCQLEDRLADEIIVTVRELLGDFRIRPYEERTGQGLLRHVLVRRGFTSGQVMVVLVTSGPILPAKNNFVTALRRKHPEITTVVQNINPKETSMVLGETEKVLYGTGYIEDTLCGKVFRLSSRSFYQVNPVQTARLYAKAIAFAELTGKERVIDAYCGIGTIGLIAADQAGEVLGVESNRAAVRDAIANAKRNGTKNIRFTAADAGEFLTGMAEEGEQADVVFLDPPRAGSTPAFLTALTKLAPKRVVYISCNPVTLARDLEQLTGDGYQVQAIQPVDLFPHTVHVECVVKLVRN